MSEASLAEAVATAVRTVPGVAELSAGPFGAVATYLPGERISGVAVRDAEVEIHLVATIHRPLPELLARVRAAVEPLAGAREVAVTVDDIVLDDEDAPDATT